MIRALAVLVLLCGCAVAPDPEPLADVTIGFRNPTAPIGGTARFDPDRFAGDWYVVQRFAKDGASVPQNKVRYGYARGAVTLPSGQRFTPDGPGVLRPADGAPVVVMWVDEGFRTAAIGAADGTWGMILDRARTSSPDRLRAAREILDWYGWDLSQLRETQA